MIATIRVHPGAVAKIVAWRRTLPGKRADRDLLLDQYLAMIAQEAVARAKSTKPPRDFFVNGPAGTRFRVFVNSIAKGKVEVVILDLE